jgi:hypothetical protein
MKENNTSDTFSKCNNECQCQECTYSQTISFADALDTIKIPGSGLLSVYDFNSALPQYGSDPLNVLPNGNVYYGNIFINVKSPNDLNVFSTVNYVNGSITIRYFNTNIIELLDIFPCLIGINGDLVFSVNAVSKITGFYKLKYIIGSLIFNSIGKSNLTSIPCFSALESVGYQSDNDKNFSLPLPRNLSLMPVNKNVFGGQINIAGYTNLLQINGFENLKYVNSIFITMNNSLQRICGFQSLQLVDVIYIELNPSLSLIKGFNCLNTITELLAISSNQTFAKQNLVIDGFEDLVVCNYLSICNNYNLKNLIFPKLQNSDIIIAGNTGLECFEFPELNVCYNFIVALNDSLRKFNVSQLYHIEGYLHIVQNNSLTYLNNFDSLTIVGMAIAIIANNSLERISDFKKLEMIGSVNSITNIYYEEDQVQTTWYNVTTLQQVLPNYVDLNIQDAVSLPNSIFIYQNNLLNNISAFNNLSIVPHSVYILSNLQLDRINAFNTATFALDFILINNHALKAIKIFEELSYIRYLIITDTMCVIKFCGLSKLCQADVIYIDVLTPDLLPNFSRPLLTVEGVYSYYALKSGCPAYNPCKPYPSCGQCQGQC